MHYSASTATLELAVNPADENLTDFFGPDSARTADLQLHLGLKLVMTWQRSYYCTALWAALESFKLSNHTKELTIIGMKTLRVTAVAYVYGTKTVKSQSISSRGKFAKHCMALMVLGRYVYK